MTRTYGTGHLTIRENGQGVRSWYGQWRTDGRKITRLIGPVREKGSKVGLSQSAAERELRQLMATVVPDARADHELGFAYASTVYQAYLRRQGRKRSTIVAVESCMRVWVIPFWRNRALRDITYHDVENLIGAMERKGLSPKSIRNYIGTLGALYAYGQHPRRGWATSNPTEGVDLPAVKPSDEIRFLTVEEVDAVIRHVPPGPYADLDRVLYRTAAMTGLRQGELVALRWQDVDWPASAIRVRRNYVLGEFDTPKSKRSSRAVPMATEVAQALAAHQPRDAADDALVFPDPLTSAPLNNAAIMRRYRRALKAAGLPASHVFHGLRHTFGTRMAAAGVPMRTLQEWMGHRDIQTTLRYADYAPAAREAEMVDQAFAREGTSEGDFANHEGTNGIQEHQ